MSLNAQESYRKDDYLPQKVTLSEESLFFAKIDRGEIKVKSNEEVLANLEKVLDLK
ncbi:MULTISPECIES: hypothetical protein [Pasteurellaceae]|jgi:hypothetical protein|uniref:hypothetical protein n=1 Tax=Pasteurellaceae TaxID=712 RepID=UPI001402CF1F|nr:hypothetical protein [Aggregatibacter aphrophilus]MDU4702974.1 hypothetical protein [Haemophilus parainfluenzae]